ncbi:MAG: type ISP restriction/modification enzyme [Pseudomonadota bacterium]
MIPDNRLLLSARPKLWACHGSKQVFLTSPEDRTPSNGPSLSLAGALPDQHHYAGRGGRVFPLWKDAAATEPNIRPAFLARLRTDLGIAVSPEDMLAYIAALAAHPAYTAHIQPDLVQPGLRIPITGTAALFEEAAGIGAEIIWLHTYGERFADPANNRPAGPPRAPGGPTIPRGGTIPSEPANFPDKLNYDDTAQRLYVGEGVIDNVSPQVRNFEVSGKNTLDQWFSYRRLDRTRPMIGDRRPPSPLDKIQPDSWPASYTEDLLNLLHVLSRLTALEERQADLLERVCTGPLIDAEILRADGIFDDDSAAVGRLGDDRQVQFLF